MNDNLLSERWDAEYKSGKYAQEQQIPFVSEIVETLNQFSVKGRGLYVGCGNGRNYIPLIEAGLNLEGLDVSPVALKMLSERIKSPLKLHCTTFQSFQPDALYDYIVAIQVFQHGTEQECKQHFEKALSLLKPNGLLFLRVNSSNTQPFFQHEIIEKNNFGWHEHDIVIPIKIPTMGNSFTAT